MNALLDFKHHSQTLERLFADCFYHSHNTLLCGGAAEPFYQPADKTHRSHVIYYREDYFASALHEVSHWCIAGKKRRELVDFGYWYEPDGRNAAQQSAFEQAEVKPQALEYLFSRACGFCFHLSADNLDADVSVSDAFAEAVFQQAKTYRQRGLPARAARFFKALSQYYRTETVAVRREDFAL